MTEVEFWIGVTIFIVGSLILISVNADHRKRGDTVEGYIMAFCGFAMLVSSTALIIVTLWGI